MIRLLLAAALTVSWDATALDCHGEPLRSPIAYYEVRASAMRLDEWRVNADGVEVPIYSPFGPYIKTGTATQWDFSMDPGDVVWWDGMWDGAWQIQPPVVEAFTEAGIGSSSPCSP